MKFFLAISTAMIRLAAACCATAILALLLARPAFAQVEPIFVVDCPGRQCPDAAAVTSIEQDALDAWRRFSALGFSSPLSKMVRSIDDLGRVVVPIEYCMPDDPGSTDRCRATMGGSLALAAVDNAATDQRAGCTDDQGWPADTTRIRVRAGIERAGAYGYYFLAHEMFHLFSLRATPAGAHLCAPGVPHWFTEGAAVYAGYWAAAQRFGEAAIRPGFDEAPARSFYGVRPWGVPLTESRGQYPYADQTAETVLGYYTSGLWRYLGERFHGGSPAYLVQYLNRTPAPCAGGRWQACLSDASWLEWLNEALRADARIALPLQEVYPQFLTEVLTWVPYRFPNLAADRWRESTFNDCQAIELSPQRLEVSITVQTRMYAGICFDVRMTGLDDGQRVRLQLQVEDGEDRAAPLWVDGTRVGVSSYGAPLIDDPAPGQCFERRAMADTDQASCLLDGRRFVEQGAQGAFVTRIFRSPALRAPATPFVTTMQMTQTLAAPGSDARNEARRPMVVRIGLQLEQASMAGAAAAVDAPVAIELDLINVAQVSRDRSPQASAKVGASACTLVIHAKNRRTREFVWLHLTQRGPIAAGRYEVVGADDGYEVPGRVVASFGVQGGAGHLLDFKGLAGSFLIDSVTHAGALAGSATLMGERCVHCASFRNRPGPARMAVRTQIVATMADPNRAIADILSPGSADRTSEDVPTGSECLQASPN